LRDTITGEGTIGGDVNIGGGADAAGDRLCGSGHDAAPLSANECLTENHKKPYPSQRQRKGHR